MILLVDIGNSRIKWCILADGVLQKSVRSEYGAAAYNSDWLESVGERPEAVYIASVGADCVDNELSSACNQRWGVIPNRLVSGTFCAGVSNGYLAPAILGVDRWAAMIGAYKLVGDAVLVIDCGTACSADVVDSNGKHLGGALMPGLQMMSQSLQLGTKRIGVIESTDLVPDLGVTTSECISLGISEGLIGFIEKMEQRAAILLGRMITVVVTGGGGETLMPRLGGHIRYEKELVFMGMATMVAHKERSCGVL